MPSQMILALLFSVFAYAEQIGVKPVVEEKTWGRAPYKDTVLKAEIADPAVKGAVANPVLKVTAGKFGTIETKFEALPLALTGLSIDTANYAITDKEPAFAVRFGVQMVAPNGNSNDDEYFQLYSVEGGKLALIAKRTSIHTHDELRDERYNESVKETYAMSRRKTDGHYDIKVSVDSLGKKWSLPLVWKNGQYVEKPE